MVHSTFRQTDRQRIIPHDYVYIGLTENTAVSFGDVSQSKAVDGDEKDISYLLSVPTFKKPKSGYLTAARIETVDGKQNVEFDVPIK